MDVRVVRLGMVGADTRTGAGNTADWLNRFVAGAALLGAEASPPGAEVALAPVDYAAAACAALLAAPPPGPRLVTLPSHATPCGALLRWVAAACEDPHGRRVRRVAGAEWAALLDSLPETIPMYPLRGRFASGLTGGAAHPCAAGEAALRRVMGDAAACPPTGEGIVRRWVDWLWAHHPLLQEAALFERSLSRCDTARVDAPPAGSFDA